MMWTVDQFIKIATLLVVTSCVAFQPDVSKECQVKCTNQPNLQIEGYREISITTNEACTWQTGSARSIDDNVQLSPTVNSTFRNAHLCNETRWRPGLKVQWPVQPQDKSFEIQWHLLPHMSDRRADPQCTKLHLPSDGEHRDFIRYCTLACPLVSHNDVFIRITSSDGGQGAARTSEGIISFRELRPGRVMSGLPIFYRHSYPGLDTTNTLPNPRYWTPVVRIWNDSLTREVRVKFDLAPGEETGVKNHKVEYYTITLRSRPKDLSRTKRRTKRRRHTYRPLGDELFGEVLFQNVTTGQHNLQIQMKSENTPSDSCMTLQPDGSIRPGPDRCFKSQYEAKAGCLDIYTGKFITHDIPAEEEVRGGEEPVRVGRRPVVVMCIIIPLGVGLIFLITVFICNRKRSQKKLGTQLIPSEGRSRKTLFIIYHGENDVHTWVMETFKQFLQHINFDCTLLSDYCPESTNGTTTALDWINNKVENSAWILYVYSEITDRACLTQDLPGDNNSLNDNPCNLLLFQQCQEILAKGRKPLKILSRRSPPSRYCIIHFNFLEESHQLIPKTLLNARTFHLMRDMDDLLQFLNVNPSYSERAIGGTCKRPNAPGQSPNQLEITHASRTYSNIRNTRQFEAFERALEAAEGLYEAGDCSDLSLASQKSLASVVVEDPLQGQYISPINTHSNECNIISVAAAPKVAKYQLFNQFEPNQVENYLEEISDTYANNQNVIDRVNPLDKLLTHSSELHQLCNNRNRSQIIVGNQEYRHRPDQVGSLVTPREIHRQDLRNKIVLTEGGESLLNDLKYVSTHRGNEAIYLHQLKGPSDDSDALGCDEIAGSLGYFSEPIRSIDAAALAGIPCVSMEAIGQMLPCDPPMRTFLPPDSTESLGSPIMRVFDGDTNLISADSGMHCLSTGSDYPLRSSSF